MAGFPGGQGHEVDPGADRLFVTKIPQVATREDISAHFARFGTTTDVYLPTIPGVPGHKGIAFVSFSEPTAMQLAINNGPHDILGHEVVVDVAAPRGAPPPNQAGPQGGPPMAELGRDPAHFRQPPAAAATDRLFVTKVPPILQRDHLREHFAQFGELTDVYMPSIPGGGTHKGICFVSFSDPTSLQLALQHAPHEIHGHQVVVDVAAPRSPAPGQGGGGGKGFGGGQGFGMGAAHSLVPQANPGWGGVGGMGAGAFAGAGYQAAAAPGNLQNTTGTPVAGRLFVTRVTPDMTKVDLQLYFQQFGQLDDVYLPTGGKGIAFVSFRDSGVSQRVLQVQQHFVKPGKAVLVDQAMDRPPLGGKGGGGGGPDYGGAAWGGARQPSRYSPY